MKFPRNDSFFYKSFISLQTETQTKDNDQNYSFHDDLPAGTQFRTGTEQERAYQRDPQDVC
jgi:hypothetical protein